MNDEALERRLLFILHRGLVEARLLAQVGEREQLYGLADALESLPSFMAAWQNCHLEVIRLNLAHNREKYPSPSFDYVRYLDVASLPDRL